MSPLPDGVARREFDGAVALATRGPPVYGEPTADGWRRWSPDRSKIASMLEHDLSLDIPPDATVLYLGAAAGTTASHIADFVDVLYAIEFAPRPMRDLLDVAESRSNLIPLLKDARRPTAYAHVVEADVDVIIQDVATRDQASVALRNRQFLASDGQLILAIKARSEDVTAKPETVFDSVTEELATGYGIEETARLEPHHVDHLGLTARPEEP